MEGPVVAQEISSIWHRPIWIALLLCVGLAYAEPSKAEIRRVLLSVDGLGLPRTTAIRSFHISSWGVEVLAVCHLPPSWELRSEKFEDPEGYLDGRSDTHGEPLKSISAMYLIDVYDYQPLAHGDLKTEYHPASFAGWVAVGSVQPFDGGNRRKRTLRAANFRLQDATQCPKPPTAHP
jgi:hypothetical protein